MPRIPVRKLLICSILAFLFLISRPLLRSSFAIRNERQKVDKSLKDKKGNDCEKWCEKGDGGQPLFFLSAVATIRVFRPPKGQPSWSTRELFQWLQYQRYIGVQHVYIYDTFVVLTESQKAALQPFIQKGFVTYMDWSERAFPFSYDMTQHTAYQHCIIYHGQESEWQLATDIDEYPFSPIDTRPGFLQRFLRNFTADPAVAEIILPNFLFMGKSRPKALLMERFVRRSRIPPNRLGKPVYRPKGVLRAQLHFNILKPGRMSVWAPEDDLRLNHYWGDHTHFGRNFGKDDEEVLDMTVEDESIQPIAKRFHDCIQYLGGDSLLQERWS